MIFLSFKKTSTRRLREDCGRGTFGCIFSLALLGVAIFGAIRIGPPWFAYKGLESDVKTEVARAGAHFLTDEAIVKELVALAEKNEVRITKDEIDIRRFADQIQITLHYSVPVDLLVFQRDMEFEIKCTSYVGRL